MQIIYRYNKCTDRETDGYHIISIIYTHAPAHMNPVWTEWTPFLSPVLPSGEANNLHSRCWKCAAGCCSIHSSSENQLVKWEIVGGDLKMPQITKRYCTDPVQDYHPLSIIIPSNPILETLIGLKVNIWQDETGNFIGFQWGMAHEVRMPLEEVPNFIEDPAGYDSRQLGPGWSTNFLLAGRHLSGKKMGIVWLAKCMNVVQHSHAMANSGLILAGTHVRTSWLDLRNRLATLG